MTIIGVTKGGARGLDCSSYRGFYNTLYLGFRAKGFNGDYVRDF